MKTPKILCLLFLLGLFSVGSLLLPGTAQAAVTCTATASNVSFGTISPQQTGTSQTNGSVSFTCTNDAVLQTAYVTLCVNIGAGTGTGTNPRQMGDGAGHNVQFQLYQDSAYSQIWGSVLTSATPNPLKLTFQIPWNTGTYTSPYYPIYGLVPGSQTGVVSGNYNNTLSGTSAQITLAHNDAFLGLGGSYPANCGTGNASSFSFAASAVVQPACTVSATNIAFGAQPATATGLQSTGTITVTCVNGTAYNVGLSPSNGNTGGAGVMSGTGGNTDKVPYQLHQTSYAGSVWGNTATQASTGNGVHGVGNGSGQDFTVYAVVPSADYAPDSYSDTVTVNVNY